MEQTLSKETRATLYASGYHLYRNGKYAEAMHTFRFLTFSDPMDLKFWMGLGAAYQMQNEFDRAIQSYACAASLDEKDPSPHLYAGECWIAKQSHKEASEALSIAEKLAADTQDAEWVNKKLALLKRSLSVTPNSKRKNCNGPNEN